MVGGSFFLLLQRAEPHGIALGLPQHVEELREGEGKGREGKGRGGGGGEEESREGEGGGGEESEGARVGNGGRGSMQKCLEGEFAKMTVYRISSSLCRNKY